MTGKGGDYDGWILRLIEKPEDIIKSFSQIDWLKFAAEKIEAYSGQGITKGQIGALIDYRNVAFDLPKDLGFKIDQVTRYRDTKGHWAKAGKSYTVNVIRGEGQKFMSNTAANELLQAEITARGVRSGKKGRRNE